MNIRVSGLLVAVALSASVGLSITGCSKPKTDGTGADSSAAGSTTMAAGAEQEKNKDLSRQFLDEVFNKGNMAFVDEHVAPDFVEHTPPPSGMEPGIAGFKKLVMEWRTGMPDLKVEVISMIAEGDMVAIHSKQSGTNSGPMMGMPATNKKTTDIGTLDLVRIKDGKMVEHWGYSEETKMMTQLGMMPPMGGAAPAAGGDHGAMHDTAAAPKGGAMEADTAKK